MSEHGQIGHNGVAGKQLTAMIERVERLEADKKEIAAEITEVYAEAKANGFDTPTMRQIVKLRRMSKAEREEKQALLDLYLHSLGMLADLPLGVAAVTKSFGTPVPLTDEEKANGVFAAWVDKDGVRSSIGTGRQTDLEEHIKAAGEGDQANAGAAGAPA